MPADSDAPDDEAGLPLVVPVEHDPFDVAAARTRAPFAKAIASHPASGLIDLGNYFGHKLMNAITAPGDALYGRMQVTDPETGMPTREAIERGQSVAGMAMTGGIPFAQRGAMGMAGGKLVQPAAEASPERIIGASYTAAGKHYVAPNHVLAMDQAVKDLGLTGTSDLVDLHGGFEGHHSANGFMTSTGRVVDRAEADRIASAAEQGQSSRPGSLKSEDMKTGGGTAEAASGTAEAHPAWIDQTIATSKKAVEAGAPKLVDLKTLQVTPKVFSHNVNLVRDYPNLPESVTKGSDEAVARAFTGHVKDNLLWLHDQVPPNIRDRSRLWYDGGNRIVKDWAGGYGLNDSAVAGTIAAMSPQRDWFQNVSLAHRVLHTMRGYGPEFYNGFKFSPEMETTFARVAEGKPEWAPLLPDLKGKSLGDLDKMEAPPDVKAGLKSAWIRVHDQAHHDPSYPLVTPEGTFGDSILTKSGAPGKIQWGSLAEIDKAIKSIEANGDRSAMQSLMGEKHKVRNFYNNLLDPNGPHGDVTIDTHAVAAGLLRPLSGKSIEVNHNFNNYTGKGMPASRGTALTGIQGTYPLYAEAYREAAKERGLLPREMQSITWEAVRGLFPEKWKTAKNNALIDDIWKRYRTGKAGIDETRNAIHEAAGGITPPDWHRPGAGDAAPLQNPGDAGGVSAARVSRRAAGGIGAGGGGQPAAGTPAITAYHGSPYDFDRFDLSKIGTGEAGFTEGSAAARSAGAYGAGLYFAENEAVAQSYKDVLKGASTDWSNPKQIAGHFLDQAEGDRDSASALLGGFMSRPRPGYDKAALADAHKILQSGGDVTRPSQGKMYHVAIKADPEHFLDWDKPLSEQHSKVAEALTAIEKKNAPATSPSWDLGGQLGRLRDHLAKSNREMDAGMFVKTMEGAYGREGAAKALREAGIPGIKYLDQESRGKGDGTSNYVVFDDKLINILKKYGIAGLAALPAMGAYHFQTKQVDHDPFTPDDGRMRPAPAAGPQVPISRLSPQGVIDVEGGLMDNMDEEQAAPGLVEAFAHIPVRDELLTEESKNIERRGDYDIFDKFRYHPLFDQIKRIFDERLGTDNKLSKEAGVKDIDRVVKEALLRTYGRKQLVGNKTVLELEREFAPEPIDDNERFKF